MPKIGNNGIKHITINSFCAVSGNTAFKKHFFAFKVAFVTIDKPRKHMAGSSIISRFEVACCLAKEKPGTSILVIKSGKAMIKATIMPNKIAVKKKVLRKRIPDSNLDSDIQLAKTGVSDG
jgi:hypothetical protein